MRTFLFLSILSLLMMPDLLPAQTEHHQNSSNAERNGEKIHDKRPFNQHSNEIHISPMITCTPTPFQRI